MAHLGLEATKKKEGGGRDGGGRGSSFQQGRYNQAMAKDKVLAEKGTIITQYSVFVLQLFFCLLR